MTEFDAEICSLYQETELFLKSQARNENIKNQPITLRTQYKNSLKLTDTDKNIFTVDETVLNAFRDIYTDKAYKAIRLSNWELQIKFIGKKCAKIDLICDQVSFLASKSIKKEITNCHFKIMIVHNQSDLKNFTPSVYGYINRLGKRSLCQQSQQIAKSNTSLLSFAPFKPLKVQTFNYHPYNKTTQNINDPLTTLSTEGKKVLQKLRHFITKQQIQQFIVDQQVSQQSASHLRNLIKQK